jgi:hypothetical protein
VGGSYRLRSLGGVESFDTVDLGGASGRQHSGADTGPARKPSAKVRAKLTEVVHGRRLVWDGNIGADRLFAGHREFLIEPQPDGTVLFTHVEDVSGLLFPLFVRSWEARSGATTRV